MKVELYNPDVAGAVLQALLGTKWVKWLKYFFVLLSANSERFSVSRMQVLKKKHLLNWEILANLEFGNLKCFTTAEMFNHLSVFP